MILVRPDYICARLQIQFVYFLFPGMHVVEEPVISNNFQSILQTAHKILPNCLVEFVIMFES